MSGGIRPAPQLVSPGYWQRPRHSDPAIGQKSREGYGCGALFGYDQASGEAHSREEYPTLRYYILNGRKFPRKMLACMT
jgi:hypothetical protein